jgi:23S rRNA (uracil1939-C5)-methyltransferase
LAVLIFDKDSLTMSDRKRPASPNTLGLDEQPDADKPTSLIWRRSSKTEEVGPCRIAETCGACKYINQKYQDILAIKFDNLMAPYSDLPLLQSTQIMRAAESPQILGYQTHSLLTVRPVQWADKNSSPLPASDVHENSEPAPQRFALGVPQPNRDLLIDLRDCPIQKDSINRLVSDLGPMLDRSELTPFDPKSNDGDIAAIEIRAAHLTNELMLTFVVKNDRKRLLKTFLHNLRNMGHNVTSAHMSFEHTAEDDELLPSQTQHLIGSQRLRESICDLSFEVSATSFLQNNMWQAEQIFRRLEDFAGRPANSAVAWDLYSGIGTLTLILARSGYRVLGVEGNPSAITDARNNSQRNSDINSPEILEGRVEEKTFAIPDWASTPDIIVANPSKQGLGPEVRELIRARMLENPACRFFYLSSEAESMFDDLQQMVQSDLEVRQLEAFDMFPYTDKMDWLAVVTNRMGVRNERKRL